MTIGHQGNERHHLVDGRLLIQVHCQLDPAQIQRRGKPHPVPRRDIVQDQVQLSIAIPEHAIHPRRGVARVHLPGHHLAGRQPDIQVNVDATRMSQAFTGTGYIQNIINGEVNSFVARYRDNSEPLVSLETRMRFNPNLDPAWFGGVMAIINNITMLAIVLTGSALIREREHGTVEHLLVMPITPFEIMMAKVWSMGLVVLVVSGLSLVLMVKGVLGVPIEGSIPLFMLGVALSLFATTSIGIFMGTIARSMPQLGLLVILVLLPLQMLSGGSTPRESMPQMVQDIMLTMPTTHFVSLAQAILYRGAGFEIVWPQFLTLMAIGGAFFTIALLRFRKTIGTMA